MLLCGCTQAIDLRPYFEESNNLFNTNADSICKFAQKFYDKVEADGQISDSVMYRQIVHNIDSAMWYVNHKDYPPSDWVGEW